MPKTKHPYSRCCGASLEITDTKGSSYISCERCGNINTAAVIDDRPFVRGDIVDFAFDAVPPINQEVAACAPSQSYEWVAVLDDKTTIGCGLLKLKKGNDEMRG